MPKVKNKIPNVVIQKGFTLIELLVVISIMAILSTIMVINLTGQRSKRDMAIAENQLVSNLRQAQSSTLSARDLSPGQSVGYYLLKFDLSKPGQYIIEAIYNASSAPQLQDVQTITLPAGILIASTSLATYPITIARPSMVGDINNGVQNISGCALIAFAAPYGKVLLNNSCNIVNPPAVDTNPNDNDDYGKIVDFVSNTSCSSSNNPVGCNVSTDSAFSITLTDTSHTVSKTVTVNGITGTVSFN
jgi:prepilin-type N-terminal cleavage/methylation domain-containing protein